MKWNIVTFMVILPAWRGGAPQAARTASKRSTAI
jgi:hypothetical protein